MDGYIENVLAPGGHRDKRKEIRHITRKSRYTTPVIRAAGDGDGL